MNSILEFCVKEPPENVSLPEAFIQGTEEAGGSGARS